VWPGEAAVVVSVTHMMRGAAPQEVRLDGRRVERITSYPFHDGGDAAPARLDANDLRGYRGAEVRGAGFVFEESPANGSWSLADTKELLRDEPQASAIVEPFMGGEEFNSSASLAPSRHVINFRRMSYAEALAWPKALSMVELRVKPMRAGNKQRNYRDDWWLFATYTPEAAGFREKHGRHLALSQVSSHLAAAFVLKGVVYANTLILLLLHSGAGFAVVQSRLHDAWARFFGSTMKDDLRYTPSDCFETFPFPSGALAAEEGDAAAQALPAVAALDAAGGQYHAHRAAMMAATGKGLTETYNRFHDPDDTAADVVTLRALHAAMDRAALAAYGWDELAARAAPTYLEEHPEAAEEAEGEKKRRRSRRRGGCRRRRWRRC